MLNLSVYHYILNLPSVLQVWKRCVKDEVHTRVCVMEQNLTCNLTINSTFLLPLDLCSQDCHPKLTNGHYQEPSFLNLSISCTLPHASYLQNTTPQFKV
jgi:hypothetical protein